MSMFDRQLYNPTGKTDLSGYVPYTGATSDVDLGTHNLTVGSQLNVLGTTPVLTINGGADDRERLVFKDEDSEMAYLSCSYASEGVRLWTQIEQNIGFGTSDVERMTITGLGNIGINNSNPLGKFVVKGVGNTTGVTFQTQNSSGTGLITMLDNCNVGIGISPTNKLQISDGNNTYATFNDSVRGLKLGRSDTITPTKTLDIAGDVNFNPIVPPTIAGVMTAALTGVPGNVPNGTQWYTVGFYDAAGNLSVAQYSQISIVVTDKTVNGQVLLSNIPTSTDPRVVGRKIYRGGQYVQQYLATIANNTATTYTDNLATTTASDNVYRRNNYTAGRFYSNGSVILQVPSQYVTAIGFTALQNNTTGYDVIAIGSALYQNTTGTSNIGIGSNAGASITTGTNNLAISYSALLGCNTGINNVALGDNSLRQNSTAGAYNYNTSVGSNSGLGIYVGSNYNTFLGYSAGAATWAGTAYGNVFLGSHPGTATLTSGNYNILIGYNVDAPAASTSNFLNIGQVIYATGVGTGGSTPSTATRIGIGIKSPEANLHIADTNILADQNLTNPNLTSGTSWTNSGDFALGSDKATYTHSSGSGYIQQASASLAVAGISNRLYLFTYTISGVSGTAPVATITTAFALSAQTLTTNANGTYTAIFRSALSPTDFRISVTSSTTGSFAIDALSLKEITGGTELINSKLGIGLGNTSPTAPLSVYEKAGMSEIGGHMVKLTNRTGSNSVKGTVVYSSPNYDNAFEVNPIDGDMPIGVVYDNGIANASECWVVTSGIAEILLVDTVATTRSYVAYSSGTTAGRIDTSATVPAALLHFREVGHTLESKTGGTNVLVKCVIHFN